MTSQRYSSGRGAAWPADLNLGPPELDQHSNRAGASNANQPWAHHRSVFNHQHHDDDEFERQLRYKQPSLASGRRDLPRASAESNSALQRFAFVKPGKEVPHEDVHPTPSAVSGLHPSQTALPSAPQESWPALFTPRHSSSAAHTASLRVAASGADWPSACTPSYPPPAAHTATPLTEKRPALTSARASVAPEPGARGISAPSRPPPTGVRLVKVSTLPDQYRSIFSGLPAFNAIQSICFQALVRSDENMVVSAPTGSGKTVLLELALIRMLLNSRDGRAIYMAPTKTLCSERAKDWRARFQVVGCSVAELTGDSTHAGLQAAYRARVIVTTPEKWDSFTRNWAVHGRVLDSLRLVLIDEVHLLNERNRGACLEIVVARMQAFGTNVRFVALSATIPNISDIAEWLGKDNASKGLEDAMDTGRVQDRPEAGSARIFEFGEDFRPCALQREVVGFPYPGDEWAFGTVLDTKLLGIIDKYANGKATLIFVPTRRATTEAASALLRGYSELFERGEDTPLPWPTPQGCASFSDARLQELASLGIAYHHAGLSVGDRRLVEQEFLNGNIRALCCTSTLAVGVNLPAHCVIVRGTKRFDNTWHDISELELIQMLGRAGRPQFDKHGVAVILTDQRNKQRYDMLVNHQTIIESTLHFDLLEHVNSEVSLRSGWKVQDVELWLRSTFLFVRMQKNPLHYAKEGGLEASLPPEEALREICSTALSRLNSHSMIDLGSQERLQSTRYGSILSRYSVAFDTMLELLQLSRATVKELLVVLSGAKEFSGIRIRQGEKTAFVTLNKHPDIRYPVAKINGAAEKINLLIQGTLACLPLHQLLKNGEVPVNPTSDVFTIFRCCSRIVMAAFEVATVKRDALTAKNVFALLRSVHGRAWDDSSQTLKQIEGIGDKSISTLVSAGIASYRDVAMAEPGRIELLLKRQPPFGHKVTTAAASLPRLAVRIAERSVSKDPHTGAISAVVEVTVELQTKAKTKIIARSKDGSPYFVTVLTMSADAEEFHDSRRHHLRFFMDSPQTFRVSCNLHKPSQSIVIMAGCDNVAGSLVTAEHKPNIDPAEFPAYATEAGAVELAKELEHLENCPDFFSDASSSEEDGAPSATRKGPAVRDGPTQAGVAPARAEKPQRLPNGNYRCGHLCRDRSACRHLCCREGATRPPKAKTTPTSVHVETSGRSTIKQKPTRESQTAQNEAVLKRLQGLIGGKQSVEEIEALDCTSEEGDAVHYSGPPSRPGKRKRSDALAQGPRARHLPPNAHRCPASPSPSDARRRPVKDSLMEITSSKTMRKQSGSSCDMSQTRTVSPLIIHERSVSHDELVSASGDDVADATVYSDEEPLDFDFPLDISEGAASTEAGTLSNATSAFAGWVPDAASANVLFGAAGEESAEAAHDWSSPPCEAMEIEAQVGAPAATSSSTPQRDRLFFSSGTGFSADDEPRALDEALGGAAFETFLPLGEAPKTKDGPEAAPPQACLPSAEEDSDSEDWMRAYTHLE